MKKMNILVGNGLNSDIPLTPEEELEAAALTTTELQLIDKCLLSHTSLQQLKVARIVSRTMDEIGERFPEIPDVFYVRRIKHIVDSGAIEAFGNLDRMRYSEIRLAK